MFIRAVLGLAVVVLLLSIASQRGFVKAENAAAVKGLTLTARKWKDEKRTLPGSMMYAAELLNTFS